LVWMSVSNIIQILFFFLFSSKNGVGRSNDKNKFWWYSLYAWASPVMMTISAILMQSLFTPDKAFKIDVGRRSCVLMVSFKEECKCIVKLYT
jgi:hypothetical protein